MKVLLILIYVIVFMVFVSCDSHSDAVEVQQRIKSLNPLNDIELNNKITNSFKPLFQMTGRRAQLAKDRNLFCYYDFYQKYGKRLREIIADLRESFNKEPNRRKRYFSLKDFAGILQTIEWDEEFRARNANIPIESEPGKYDYVSTLRSKFDHLVRTLTTGLKLVSLQKGSEGFQYSQYFYQNLGSEFAVIYPEAKQCCTQSSDERKCLRVFVNEIKRFIYVATLRSRPINANSYSTQFTHQ